MMIGSWNHARAGRVGPVLAAAAVLASAWLAPAIAHAQQSLANVFNGFSSDPSTPIDITADKLTGNDVKKTAIYKGNVIAIRGDYTLKTVELEVHYTGKDESRGKTPGTQPAPKAPTTALGGDGQQIRRILAKEQVVMTSTKDQSATAKNADYDVIAGTLVLTGDVFIKQGQSVVCGQRVVINLKSGEYTVERDQNATAQINPACPQGRVSTVLYPQAKDQQPPANKTAPAAEKTEPATRTLPKPFIQRTPLAPANQ